MMSRPEQLLRMFVLAGFGCVGVVFATTGPSPFDAGELMAAAFALGASHPPGQPLHAIVGHLVAWLPIGSIPFRVALLSVFGQVMAAYFLMRFIEELHRAMCHSAIGQALPADNLGTRLLRFAPEAGAVALLLSPPVLRQAFRIEVYGPALALTMFSLCRLTQWLHGQRAAHLIHAVLGFGLCSAVHPPHAMVILLSAAGIVLVCPARQWLRVRLVGWVILAGLLSGFVHAWLPLRARAGAPTWGDPTSLSGFWDYVSAKAYRMNLGVHDSSWATQFADALAYSLSASGLFPLVGVALLGTQLKGKPIGWLRGLIVVFVMLGAAIAAGSMQPLEISNPDNIAYLAPATALWIAFGITGFVIWAEHHHNRFVVILSIGILALNIPALVRITDRLEADHPALETLASALTEAPPPRALVITETDFVGASWMMAQSVDGARPDVAVFISGLATSSWHWKLLDKHPAMDGKPARGQGQTAFEAYNDGIVQRYKQTLPIVSESHMPTRGYGLPLGAYVYLPSSVEQSRDFPAGSMAERWSAAIGRDTVMARWQQVQSATVILRHYEMRRATRLVLSNRSDEALEAIRYGLNGLDDENLRLVQGARVKHNLARPPVVHEPDVYLLSLEDAVREASTLLWAMGAGDAARALLDGQLGRGDPRSVLQLAWLRLAEGDSDSAQKAVNAFLTVAPELADEAAPLTAHLKPE